MAIYYIFHGYGDGLNKNGLHSRQGVVLLGGVVRIGIGVGVALLEEVCDWRQALGSQILEQGPVYTLFLHLQIWM